MRRDDQEVDGEGRPDSPVQAEGSVLGRKKARESLGGATSESEREDTGERSSVEGRWTHKDRCSDRVTGRRRRRRPVLGTTLRVGGGSNGPRTDEQVFRVSSGGRPKDRTEKGVTSLPGEDTAETPTDKSTIGKGRSTSTRLRPGPVLKRSRPPGSCHEPCSTWMGVRCGRRVGPVRTSSTVHTPPPNR